MDFVPTELAAAVAKIAADKIQKALLRARNRQVSVNDNDPCALGAAAGSLMAKKTISRAALARPA